MLVGNYRVVDVIGEGGMGRVYRARHPEIDRMVAIKVLALALADSEDVVRRFRIEARAVNRIRHPNVVDVQDFGTLPDGRPYYVMEYLEGESLHAYLRRVGALSVADTIVLLLPVLEALEAAHRAGVVHRDLKPENIFLVGRPGLPAVPKVLDFGIAKVVGEVAGEGARVTQSGAVMGTPLYMSPEQAAGRVAEVGPTSDVYSLGVIAYQMLAGVTPFRVGSLGELLLAHMQETPPPLREQRPGLPAEIDALVMSMLAKQPGHRPPSVAAVHARASSIAASLGVSATLPLTQAPLVVARPLVDAVAETMAPVAAAGPVGSRAPAPAPAPAPSVTPSAFIGEVGARVGRGGSRRAWLVGAAALVVVAVTGGLIATRGDGGEGGTTSVPARAPDLVDRATSSSPPGPPAERAPAAPAPVPAATAAAAPDARVDDEAPAPPGSELERRLEALKRLYDEKLITGAEYERRRQQILTEL